MKILRLFLEVLPKEAYQEKLTSNASTGDLANNWSNNIIEGASFGSNQIITKIGRDRSHISQAIQFLMRNKLLKEGTKWKQGKIKDIRITGLGIEIAQLSNFIQECDTLFARSGSEETVKERTEARKKEEGISSSRMTASSDEYKAALDAVKRKLRNIRRSELNLFLRISNKLIADCMLIMIRYAVKSDVKGIMEEIVIGFIRNRFQNMLITNSEGLSVDARKAAYEDVLFLMDGLWQDQQSAMEKGKFEE
jgi:hypothetical protein